MMITGSFKYRYQILLFMLLGLITVIPFFESVLIASLMAMAVLVGGMWIVSDDKNLLKLKSFFALGAISFLWAAHYYPTVMMAVTASVFDFLFLGFVAAIILSHVFQSKKITRETIAGAICAYLLFGLLWADIFTIMECLSPGSFSGGLLESHGVPLPVSAQIVHFSYFSFVTLSTLGYGDITPLTKPARNLASLEAIFGQLYLAILIARLVSQQINTNEKWNIEKNNHRH